jgi:hypothetical protein
MMYLTGNPPLQLDIASLTDETKFLQNFDTLFIIGEKLQILIRHHISEFVDALSNQILFMVSPVL